MSGAPLSGFYRLPVAERLAALVRAGKLSPEDAEALRRAPGGQLTCAQADHMVENVLGVFGLPFAVAPNLRVDGVDRQVPLVVEEPSIVAALSAMAKLTRPHGGFVTEVAEQLMVGQIELYAVADAAAAVGALRAASAHWCARANALLPNLVRRGGGVRGLEAKLLPPPAGPQALLVHLLVDTCDAMGANLINTLCERLAPMLAAAVGGAVGLRILSNLTERSLAHCRVRLPCAALAPSQEAGARLRDGIVRAANLAVADVHRAVTHNKGIFNAVDAIALATGNDWRAIEANGHAFAGLGQGYGPLSRWSVGPEGDLVGALTLPLKVGTVGGNFAVNPGVGLSLRLLGATSADALVRVMAAAGLAQNLAALRALGGEGIQRGHMTLHARSVAASAGVPPEHFAEVVRGLVASGEVKVWQAQALLAQAQAGTAAVGAKAAAPMPATKSPPVRQPGREPSAKHAPVLPGSQGTGQGAGKILLLGEHAVVYGAHALAVPLALATRVTARVPATSAAAAGVHVSVPNWQVQETLRWQADAPGLHRPLALILRRMGLAEASLRLDVDARVPRAMGLGSSAALAVATVRALSALGGQNWTDGQVMALAQEAEDLAHGRASGVDNALATYGRPLLFRRQAGQPHMQFLSLGKPLMLVVGQTQEPSLTHTTVARVAAKKQARPGLCQALFDGIDKLAIAGVQALAQGDGPALGEAMNHNHDLLQALEVSTPQLDEAVRLARAHGALGAKLTGGGGGGSMVALCADAAAAAAVAQGLTAAGFGALCVEVPSANQAGQAPLASASTAEHTAQSVPFSSQRAPGALEV